MTCTRSHLTVCIIRRLFNSKNFWRITQRPWRRYASTEWDSSLIPLFERYVRLSLRVGCVRNNSTTRCTPSTDVVTADSPLVTRKHRSAYMTSLWCAVELLPCCSRNNYNNFLFHTTKTPALQQ